MHRLRDIDEPTVVLMPPCGRLTNPNFSRSDQIEIFTHHKLSIILQSEADNARTLLFSHPRLDRTF